MLATKILPSDAEIPTQGYNIQADFSTPMPLARSEGIVPAPETNHVIKRAWTRRCAARRAVKRR